MSALECPKPTLPDATVSVRYVIEDQVVVQTPTALDHALDVWVPVIPDTPSQRVLGLAIDANCTWSVAREAEFGNQMLHACASGTGAQGWPLQIGLRYQVERLPVAHALHPACARPLTTPELLGACPGGTDRHWSSTRRSKGIACESVDARIDGRVASRSKAINSCDERLAT